MRGWVNEGLWCLTGLAFVLATWILCNRMYGRIYGHQLRWRYLWAAHGLLLFPCRRPEWERSTPARRSA